MKIKNNKPHDLDFNHKLWKAGDIIEVSESEANGLLGDPDFELIDAPSSDQKKPEPISHEEEI